MQNSLERLVGSVEDFLRDEVAPKAARDGDDFLRAQAAAAAEVLENLAPRITWNPEVELAWTGAVRELAAEAAAQGRGREELDSLSALPDPGSVGSDPSAVEAYLVAHLDALAALAALANEGALSAELASRVASAVDEQARRDEPVPGPRIGGGNSR